MEPLTTLDNLKRRSALLRAVRDEFYAEGFFEVTTEVKIPAPAPEEYIESLTCGKEFLRSSPELAMKRLLCGGADKIFQIGPAFRAGEYGRKHREEFTIMEYYSIDWDYRKLAEFTAKMLKNIAEKICGRPEVMYKGRRIDFTTPSYITVDEAFRRYAGYDLLRRQP